MGLILIYSISHNILSRVCLVCTKWDRSSSAAASNFGLMQCSLFGTRMSFLPLSYFPVFALPPLIGISRELSAVDILGPTDRPTDRRIFRCPGAERSSGSATRPTDRPTVHTGSIHRFEGQFSFKLHLLDGSVFSSD